MEKKKEFRYFSIFNYEDEEKYIRSMHNEGWKFVKVSGFGMFHFEKCEPEDVIYRLDYNKEGLNHKDEYVKMFEDCGWEYIQDYAGYSYFRKKAAKTDENEGIFCDDSSKREMMKRVYKDRLSFLLLFFLLFLVPSFIMSLLVGRDFILTVIYGFLIGIYLAIFLIFANGFVNSKKKFDN